MSSIVVNDQRGGIYRTAIEFTYGECERLPFNILRRMNAKIAVVANGGIKAVADFNIRNPRESALFLETLDLFGANGSFVHGSAADPALIAKTAPPDGEGAGTVELDQDDDGLEIEEPLP